MLFTHSLTALYSFTYYLQYTSVLTKKEIFQHVTAESFSSKTENNPLYGSWLSQVITVSARQCNFVQQGAVIIAHPQYTQNPLESMVWYGMVW